MSKRWWCGAAWRALAGAVVLAAGCTAAAGDGQDQGVQADLGAPPDLATASAACAALGLPVRAFDARGPYGSVRDALADDFTLTDQDGPWRLAERWSGCESYVFVLDSTAVSPLDRTSVFAADLDALVAKSDAAARNVHYFFVSSKAAPAASLQLLADQLDAALAPLPDGDAPGGKGWWRARLHLVQAPASQLTPWLAKVLTQKPLGSAGFAIDRSQRLRGLGSFADVNRYDGALQAAGQWPWQNDLAYAAHPPISFNYEAARADRLAAEAASTTTLTVFDHQMLVGDQPKDVDFPDAATMATFDTLEIDLTLACPDAATPEEADNCGAWDYMIGVAFDAIEQLVVPPDGGVPDGGAPPVPYAKEGHEAARFVTTYHRAGSFTVDASHVLPYLRAGGRQRLLLTVGGQPYVTTLALRLRDAHQGLKPTHTRFLWWGGVFNADYDPNHAAPLSVDIPATARRVELRATITGHGAETSAQCAEFCNHQHRFTVNGHPHLREFTDDSGPQNPEGCLGLVGAGAVPNQSGTWWLGRGGWCPGMQVEPWIVDVTSEVTPGQAATLAYQGQFKGRPPATGLGKIDMGAWLTIWE